MKTYYTVYKTTNKINEKIYIGVHRTKEPNDDYLGSGTLLKKAIEKYGIENFEKEILHIFDNEEDMFAMEKELLTEEFLSRTDTYNTNGGGFGSWRAATEVARVMFKEKYQNDENFREFLRQNAIKSGFSGKGKKLSAQAKKNISDARTGCTHSDTTKEKISQSLSGQKMTDERKKNISKAMKGKKTNYNYMFNLELKQSKRIHKDEQELYLKNGWEFGRKMKFE